VANRLKAKEDKETAPRKDGTDSILVYFLQVGDSLLYSCVWCEKVFKASTSSYYNLKIHRDGSNIKGTFRAACPSQSKAMDSGCKLPQTAAQIAQEINNHSSASKKSNNTIVTFVTKGRFDNTTFNKLMVFWIIQHSLPWARFDDQTLCINLDFLNPQAKSHSQTWAATTARSLYLSLQKSALDKINVRQQFL
jgi:hypothetical protein